MASCLSSITCLSLSLVTCSVLLVTAIATSTSASVSSPEILLTQASLLGGLDSDCEPNITTACEVNVVEAVAWCRSIKQAGIPHIFFPTLDRSHILTKLHPKDWGANFALHAQLKAARAVVSPLGFSTEATAATYAVAEDDPVLLDNFDFPVAHKLRQGVTATLIDRATGLLFVAARRRVDDLGVTAKTAATAIVWARLFSSDEYTNTVVFCSDDTPAAFAAALAHHGARPDIICRLYAATDGVEFKNGTWLVNVKTTKTHLHRIQIHRLSSTSSTIVNVTLTAQPLELPAANRTDPQYVADRAMMKAEALIAAANNPVQGSTAGPMPAPTAPDGAALCRRSECAMGNLWADAIRNVTETDISLFSGPWLKGPGWHVGNVTLRDVLSAYGFIEPASKATVLGLSLFELWNHSLSVHAFDPYMPTTETGTRNLPQVSGMRIKYNLARANVNDRLISIEVWDKATSAYRPLERLKKYTVSGPQYLMQSSDVHRLYVAGRYRGEAPPTAIDTDVQDFVRMFLARTNGQYVPGIFGRILEDNSSELSMRHWNEAATGCPEDFIMDSSMNTCVRCPAGTKRDLTSAMCVEASSPAALSSTVLALLLAAACIAALSLAIAAMLAVMRWQRHKRIRYCPKDPGAPIAAFFVTVRNEIALKEGYPITARAAFKRIEEVVVRAANDHKCFVARRLGAHFLVVGTDPVETVKAAAQVQQFVENPASNCLWNHLLSPGESKRPHRGPSPDRTVSPNPLALSPSLDSELSPTSALVTSQPSSSCASCAGDALVPITSAGMAFGAVTIDYDDEFDTWSYSGPIVDAAAAVADAARPGQFLATEALVQATETLIAAAPSSEGRPNCGGVASLGADFTEFFRRRMHCPIVRAAADVLLLQMDSTGLPHHHFADVSIIESDTAGPLTAALEVAAGGLTTRTVGVVCWVVPALRSPKAFASRAVHAQQLEAVLNAFAVVCRGFRADLTCAMDGTFVAVVNGAAPRTAQVAATVAALARTGIAAAREESAPAVVAGVATGPAMTGPVNGTIVLSGVVVERAKLLATVGFATTHGPQAVVAESDTAVNVFVSRDLVEDLDPFYILAAVDAVAWPDHCVTHRAAARLPVEVFAVIAEKDLIDDEWMYQLGEASASDPYGIGNNILRDALAAKFVELDVSTLEHPATTGGFTAYPTIRLDRLLLALADAARTDPSVAAVVRVLRTRVRELCFTFPHDAADEQSVTAAWKTP